MMGSSQRSVNSVKILLNEYMFLQNILGHLKIILISEVSVLFLSCHSSSCLDSSSSLFFCFLFSSHSIIPIYVTRKNYWQVPFQFIVSFTMKRS